MAVTEMAPSSIQIEHPRENKLLFWGCFLALVTTSFGFIARVFLVSTWATEFGLDAAQSGRLMGIGIWPFAVSIIGFSLVIDKIGYKVSMMIAFAGHIIWAIMGVSAYYVSQTGDKTTAFQLLYWGSFILALGNGTVEAFINPVVATMFHHDKTKWLNILHAGWPGGLVIAGVITIFAGDVPWAFKVGLIAAPAILYFIILMSCEFPTQERVASGVSYRDMLAEFGIGGAIIVGFLLTLQLMDFFSDSGAKPLSATEILAFAGIGVALVIAFGVYTRSLGRPILLFLILIMMPLATTEIGTDGWISAIMESIAKDFHPGWILVYTSIIMMVLRFFAGPIVHQLSPLGLLALSALLAVLGLYTLSFSAGAMIFVAATLYGFGKTFFWPTMLGVVAEQTPRGGALTLNAISGIGMIAVGTLGTSFIGILQTNRDVHAVQTSKVAATVPGLVEGSELAVLEKRTSYQILDYRAINDKKLDELLAKLPADDQKKAKAEIAEIRGQSKQGALAMMAFFPVFMLVCYLILIGYFKSRGGYRPVSLDAAEGH